MLHNFDELRAKTYNYLTDKNDENKKSKGTEKRDIKDT